MKNVSPANIAVNRVLASVSHSGKFAGIEELPRRVVDLDNDAGHRRVLATKARALELMEILSAGGMAVVHVTHDMDDAARAALDLHARRWCDAQAALPDHAPVELSGPDEQATA